MTEEDKRQLRVDRGRRKAAVTKGINSLVRYMAEDNVDMVNEKRDKLIKDFAEFEQVHESYYALLEEEAECDTEDGYFYTVHNSYITVLNDVKDWRKSIETDNQSIAQSDRPDLSSSDSSILDSAGLLSLVNLPKIELEQFEGDPAKYHSFISMFDECVDKVVPDSKIKLTRLIQYTKGKAREAIRACSLMGDPGYGRARTLLEQRFGNQHLVTESIIHNIRSGKPVKSSEELQMLADDLVNCHMTLDQMGRLHEVESQTCIVEVINRVQPYIRNRWKKYAVDYKAEHDRYPCFQELVEFMRKQAEAANDPVYGKLNVKSNDSKFNQSKSNDTKPKAYSSSFSTQVNIAKSETPYTIQKCSMCQGAHRLFYCERFKQMKPVERLQFVKQHNLCENCLLGNHATSRCRKSSVCSVPGCGKKHTKFIHVSQGSHDRDRNYTADVSERHASDNDSMGNKSKPKVVNGSVNTGSSVYMPIVCVRVNGSTETCALLDSGSSNTFCSKNLVQSLGIHGSSVSYELSTLNTDDKAQVSQVVNLHVSSLDGSESLKFSNVYVVDKIPVASYKVDTKAFNHLKELPLVDGGNSVELLIGQDNAEALIPFEVRRGDKGQPFAAKTLFGWVVNGPSAVVNYVKHSVVSNFISTHALEDKVAELWNIENAGIHDSCTSWSQEDKQVINLWDKECVVIDSHYQLPIPWRSGVEFPNNMYSVLSRLKSLQSSLIKRNLYDQYAVEMTKLLEAGYAEPVPIVDMQNSERIWYLPHQAVISPSKPGKLRIVFDCAAKYKGQSLNDKCYQGPDLTNKLLHVLLRFREHKYAVSSDIQAMYYQIVIPECDRDALRFLWFSDTGEISHYRMTRHVFGGIWCSSSSTYALRHTVIDAENVHPLVDYCINHAFYVDDCLVSVPDKDSAMVVIHVTKALLQEYGFNLTKFVVNDKSILETLPVEDRATDVNDLLLDAHSKVLGVKWGVVQRQYHG